VPLRRLIRRFLPRRRHPLLDAEVVAAPRDAENRARYFQAVRGEEDVFVTQRYDEGCRWRQVLRHYGGARRVLDVGGGNGAIELAFAADPAAVVVSVDALWNDVARVLGVRRVVADGAALPFRGAVFDAVLCLETIEHLAKPREVVGEIARVAAPEAVVLVTTPPKWRYAWRRDPHFGIRALTLWPPRLQRAIAARRGFADAHHYVDRIYASVTQLRRVFRGLAHVETLSRSRAPRRWFWDALVFRKR
jgi:SAM-dependent methyltransferase